MLTLSSDMETVCNIINDVIPCLEENGSRMGNGEDLDLRMMIHQSQAGCVIGKGGSKIKEIRDQIGTRIKIFSNCAPQSTDRVIQIIGSPDKCIDTIKEILLLLKSNPIKGAVNPYDPHNFDEFYSEEYGGFGGGNAGGTRQGPGGGGGGGGGPRGGGRAGGSGNRGPPSNMGNRNMRSGDFGGRGNGGPPPRGGGFGGRGGNMGGGFNPRGGNMGGPPPSSRGFGGGNDRGFNLPPSRGNDMPGSGGSSGGGFGRNSTWNSPMNRPGGSVGGGGSGNQPHSGSLMAGAGGRMSSGRMNQPPPIGGGMPPNGPGKNSTQVTIPKDLAGAIIGKGGGRIRKIRADSGAGITIDEPLPGSNDRIITITGSPNQIQMAQYLLQQSVHNNTDNRNY
ncbi:heterogeneous nuclear ribonucleoprotein K isoform X2 [Agrilus planipennis]|uniref:Heterogeneous nuclear ribonucleoprotein K isoform X2 n=1 Tax=Agrilus planipennis TaxID=224129 RepID=A0A1W4WFL1_AGRPL|nr:heterogeneous nuclear ribonucleoprotein K isoform X2 [Agrilus planipennis]